MNDLPNDASSSTGLSSAFPMSPGTGEDKQPAEPTAGDDAAKSGPTLTTSAG